MIDPCNPLARVPEKKPTTETPSSSRSSISVLKFRNPLFRRPTAPAPPAGGTRRHPTTSGKAPRKGPHPSTGGKGPQKAPMGS